MHRLPAALRLALLGPQYRTPCVAPALAALGLADGTPLASLSAGWQEREGEVDELRDHVQRKVTDLGLYAAVEQLLATDTPYARAYRERQARLQERQALYRQRLDALKDVLRAQDAALADADAADAGLLREARRGTLADLRRLDQRHLAAIRNEQAAFVAQWPVLADARRVQLRNTLAAALAKADGVLIPGGHIAVLLNRLRVVELDQQLIALAHAGQPVVAWGAGAMALSPRVVLFHDRPPQGAGDAEVLDLGLGLAPCVALPDAAARLALDNPTRLRRLAQRFAPDPCLTLPHGGGAAWRRGTCVWAQGVTRLTRRGAQAPLAVSP